MGAFRGTTTTQEKNHKGKANYESWQWLLRLICVSLCCAIYNWLMI